MALSMVMPVGGDKSVCLFAFERVIESFTQQIC